MEGKEGDGEDDSTVFINVACLLRNNFLGLNTFFKKIKHNLDICICVIAKKVAQYEYSNLFCLKKGFKIFKGSATFGNICLIVKIWLLITNC